MVSGLFKETRKTSLVSLVYSRLSQPVGLTFYTYTEIKYICIPKMLTANSLEIKAL